MKCTLCGEVAMRLGTKGRAYCKTHAQNAWSQVGKENDTWDARHHNEWADRRLEIHQEHLARAV